MKNINPIYHNPFGVAFQWKRSSATDRLKIQLVFRNTGLLLTYKELKEFLNCISHTLGNSQLCQNCSEDKNCKALLLETPINQLSFAMSMEELRSLQELVEGTVFQLELDHLLYKND
ncbi:MAG: hypothetical protein AAGC43_10930 [Bacteroidota bacterium]